MAEAMTGPLRSGGRVMAMDGLGSEGQTGRECMRVYACVRVCVCVRVRVCAHFRHETARSR